MILPMKYALLLGNCLPARQQASCRIICLWEHSEYQAGTGQERPAWSRTWIWWDSTENQNDSLWSSVWPEI